MTPQVSIQVVPARMLAAVRRQVRVGEVSTAWRPALDQVWQFLRQRPHLRTDGHNIFLYHHPASRDLPMEVDFGVEVVRSFESQGEVVLAAVISKDGAIENLRVVRGHPLLVKAALTAVQQWRYRPYVLNGEPIEVETQVTVNFVLAGGGS